MFNQYYSILEYYWLPSHPERYFEVGLVMRYVDKSLRLVRKVPYSAAVNPNWEQCDKLPIKLLSKQQYAYLINLFEEFIFDIFWQHRQKITPTMRYETKRAVGRMITERNRRTK